MSYNPPIVPRVEMDTATATYPAVSGRQQHGPPVHTNGVDANHLINHHFAGMAIHGGMPNHGAMPMGPQPQWFPVADNGVLQQASFHAMQQQMGLNPSNESHYPAMPGPGYHPSMFGLPMAMNSMVPFTPGRPNLQPRMDRAQSEVPGLENRRGSYSTTESAPATPFWGGVSIQGNGPRVASLERSAYTTPSPQQLGMASIHCDTSKVATPAISERNLDELLKKEPAIPKAVPAVFTPPGQMKSLEQSLENRIPGNRNVYIRGLHPTTDDELLYHFAARFGAVETSKAIIDTGTGACKGFGFAKFYHSQDSETCIRAFHRLGYEVGFARESFNSRLKAQGDEGSTNLYISNLPKTLTEVELGTIFLGYDIMSSKILRDSMGNSRGVGFARFEDRDICDDVIRKFNGLGIGEEGLLMNIRYADTPAQKELKRVTAERRQFRTNEYNIGAYGTPLVGMNPTVYNQQTHWRRNGGASRNENAPQQREERRSSGRSGSHKGESETTTGSSSVTAASTPTLSECGEGATLHADPDASSTVHASQHSSPIKKEVVKSETQ